MWLWGVERGGKGEKHKQRKTERDRAAETHVYYEYNLDFKKRDII